MTGHTTLEQALGYQFRDAALLERALTHRSHSARHNERLEFLGDSVLNFVVASLLFRRFTKIDEGDLSRVRASLVKQSSLADIAQRLALSQHLRLGEGELKSGGFRRPSILADALEAIFGAIFIDAGFDAVQKVIADQYAPMLAGIDPKTLGKDAKTLLQEVLQGRGYELPAYRVLATHGAAHDQMFEVECAIPVLSIAVSASGGSRRAAEQSAATLALAALKAVTPAKRSGGRARAHKSTQLSLPVAVVQESK
ncbi:MAG: ribonuclease III [Candidimonas sp.]|nr:MAG: ribonuclease III [Candidimonas sp.]